MSARSTHSALADIYDARSATYQHFGNNTLLGLVRDVLPPGGSVLDVGCASGGLLAALHGDAGRRVGLELSESAAAAARAVADRVVVGDVADESLDLGEAFDVVVLADVVEHTVDSVQTLTAVRRLVAPKGRIVVSVPNVAHWWMRMQLARGRWDYAESGVLDRGHLRFFTRRSIEADLVGAGYVVDRVVPVVPRLRNHVPVLQRLPGGLDTRIERAWQRIGGRRPDIMAYQLLVVAHVAESASPSPGSPR